MDKKNFIDVYVILDENKRQVYGGATYKVAEKQAKKLAEKTGRTHYLLDMYDGGTVTIYASVKSYLKSKGYDD